MNTTTSTPEYQYQVPQSPEVVPSGFGQAAGEIQSENNFDLARLNELAMGYAEAQHPADPSNYDLRRAEFGSNVIDTITPQIEVLASLMTPEYIAGCSKRIVHWRQYEQTPTTTLAPIAGRDSYELKS